MGVADLFRLDGRVALVTGSSQGIGRAIALALAEHGASVAVNHVGDPDGAEAVRREAEAFGIRAVAVEAELGQPGESERLYRAVLEELGPPDILVSNAAVQVRKAWLEISPEEFERQVNVNLRAGLELMQLAVPAMTARGWGRVLTVGSVQQARPHRDMLIYAATKSAQLSLVRNLARQLAPSGVTVNNLAPGVINTARGADALADPAYRATVLSWIPLGAIGEPVDCAGAALLLCSPAGRYITGADLFVDGGMQL